MKKLVRKIQNSSMLCEYGCGKIANFELIFSNNKRKLCCVDTWQACQKMKKGQSSGNKGKIPWNKGKEGQKCSIKTKEKMRIAVKLSIRKIKEKYPFFYKLEEMRYDLKRPKERIIQVHCKNHNCPNSKEKHGWFTPTHTQLQSRIYALEKREGNGGRYLYCSNKCKNICPLYNLHPSYEISRQTDVIYTDAEYNMFKKEVFRRQKEEFGYNECEICGSKNDLHVHHEKPQKTHPNLSLDPDNGIILCGHKANKCHYKYGHKGECSTGKLSTKICIKENNKNGRTS